MRKLHATVIFNATTPFVPALLPQLHPDPMIELTLCHCPSVHILLLVSGTVAELRPSVLCPLLPNLLKPLYQCLSRVSALVLWESSFLVLRTVALKLDYACDLLACKECRSLFPTVRDPDSVAVIG